MDSSTDFSLATLNRILGVVKENRILLLEIWRNSMAKKIKTGNVNIPIEDFEDENVTAHISIRLPLNLVKDLKKLSLNEEYEGRYQVLIREILQAYTEKSKKNWLCN